MVVLENHDINLLICKNTLEIPYENAIQPIVSRLDEERGVAFSSNVEFPGRYSCWDIGFVNPPISINGWGLQFSIEALNSRGEIILQGIFHFLKEMSLPVEFTNLVLSANQIKGSIKKSDQYFTEEQRSRQPSIFSLLRALVTLFKMDDSHLGFYGAFGYDLAFQFEPVVQLIQRDPNQRDLALYLPDEIYVVDHRKQMAMIHQYDFSISGQSTRNLPRQGKKSIFLPASESKKERSIEAGDYSKIVEIAKEYFKRGDLFEVVPSQSFYRSCERYPSKLFNHLCSVNPSPYSFIFNLGGTEYLVGISPEMFVRVTGDLVETRPISGTIKRGRDAIEDAENILKLLNSKKDESELTMCTDVDRNDKSRVCLPGSVKLTGRREIEKYSTLFHTVDHVEGIISPEFDAIDAFLSHAWAVTVTGAPKKSAMQFIESHESTPRKWYGGAIGWIKFNGDMNTGIAIRTIQIFKGIAEVRVGATLLYDSDPSEEEKETELKASAMLQALSPREKKTKERKDSTKKITKKNLLFIDHEDSFVNTLSNYFRQLGARVTTVRSDFPEALLHELKPDLIVLSPGPGRPEQFNMARNISLALKYHIPIFGVCLGLQGIVEYFGGTLKKLEYPTHGKKDIITLLGDKLFNSLPKKISVGRYHSLYVDQSQVPKEFVISALSEDGVVMAVEHRNLPIAAVQFHPESIMSADKGQGMKIIENVLKLLGTCTK